MPESFDKNKYKKIIKDLGILGLTDKESQVYLSLLKLGEVGSSKIIQDTGLHGQFVYQSLSTLDKKSLINQVAKKGRKKFSAVKPYILHSLIDAKKAIVEKVVGDIEALITVPQEQKIQIIQGAHAYKAAELNYIEKVLEKSEILTIGGSKDQFARILARDFNKYESIRNKKEISIRYIGNKEQKHELNVFSQARMRFDYRILNGSFSGLNQTNIYTHFVTTISFSDPVTSVYLENPEIAMSYKEFFETLWNLGTK